MSLDPNGLLFRMFNQHEIQILLGGVNSPIDWDDLRTNTNYGGLYDDKEETIVRFWNVSLRFPISPLLYLGFLVLTPAGQPRQLGGPMQLDPFLRCFSHF
jgi:hypothetical protein